ncbi:MAG: hypothetical protein V3V00_11380 [Saprospiraceae bacterium]
MKITQSGRKQCTVEEKLKIKEENKEKYSRSIQQSILDSTESLHKVEPTQETHKIKKVSFGDLNIFFN